jgi:hypothetical protein
VIGNNFGGVFPNVENGESATLVVSIDKRLDFGLQNFLTSKISSSSKLKPLATYVGHGLSESVEPL